MLERLMRIEDEKHLQIIVGKDEEFHLENCPKLQRTNIQFSECRSGSEFC